MTHTRMKNKSMTTIVLVGHDKLNYQIGYNGYKYNVDNRYSMI